MFWSRSAIAACAVLAATPAMGEGYVLGAGIEGDSADGRAVGLFGDFSVGERTWLSLTARLAETEGIVRDNETVLYGTDLDIWFDPIGIRLGGAYWGNADILDSRDFKAALYARGEIGSIALDYEKREFEFDLQSDLLRGRTAEFSADGLGVTARLSLGDDVSVFAGAMSYDYSRNLRIQPDIDVLAFVSNSRLSMINNLIDERASLGVEYRFGLKSVDFSAGQWQTAVDGTTIDSYSIGFLTPLSDRTDAEFRLSFDDSESYGRTTAFSVYFYFFGGS